MFAIDLRVPHLDRDSFSLIAGLVATSSIGHSAAEESMVGGLFAPIATVMTNGRPLHAGVAAWIRAAQIWRPSSWLKALL